MQGNAILGLQLGTTEPHFSLVLDGKTMLTETRQNSLFIILCLFLFYCDNHGGTLGGRSLESLQLTRVVTQPKRFVFTMFGKSLF